MRRKTQQEWEQEVQDLVGDSYVFLEPYKNDRTKLMYYHIDCGHINFIRSGSFIRGTRCSYCSKIKRNLGLTKTNEQWLKQVKDLAGDEYTFLEPYKGNHTPIKYRHNLCGYIGKISPANFLQGHGCSYCSPTRNLSNEDFINKVKKLVDNEYTIISEYKTNRQPVVMKHNKCGQTWSVLPVNFLNGSRCPYCNESKGEKLVQKVLVHAFNLELNNDFYHAYVLPNRLHLDFYIPEYKLGIEYDGIQHYKPRTYFGGEKQFKIQQQRDLRKDRYCKEHGIKLIRIPYTITTFSEVRKVISSYITFRTK